MKDKIQPRVLDLVTTLYDKTTGEVFYVRRKTFTFFDGTTASRKFVDSVVDSVFRGLYSHPSLSVDFTFQEPPQPELILFD